MDGILCFTEKCDDTRHSIDFFPFSTHLLEIIISPFNCVALSFALCWCSSPQWVEFDVDLVLSCGEKACSKWHLNEGHVDTNLSKLLHALQIQIGYNESKEF